MSAPNLAQARFQANLAALPEHDPIDDLVWASSVVARDPEWLWDDRFLLGGLVVLEGDPGLGKSTMMLELSARVTTGTAMPFAQQRKVPPSPVIYMSGEDSIETTLRPRFEIFGGDLDYLTFLEERKDTGEAYEFPEDLDRLEHLIGRLGARLVVIDVLDSFLSDRHDTYKSQSVRKVLYAFRKVAERTNCCITILRHLNKGGGGGKAINAGNGSISIAGAARSVVGVYVDTTDDETDLRKKRRVLATVKGNLAKDYTSYAWRFQEVPGQTMPTIDWVGPSSLTANDLVQPIETQQRRSKSAAVQAAIVRVLNAAPGGLMKRTQLKTAVLADGHAETTFKEVLKQMHDDLDVQIYPDPAGGRGNPMLVQLS